MIIDFAPADMSVADLVGIWTYVAPPSTQASPGEGGTRLVEQIFLEGTAADRNISLGGNIDD